ncbi:hypothetical protein Taro_009185 [Colocasia esculenta]|uniref:Plant heme peroxidase family profile domain-containing protein n=1 Tax=Colocasia esculenta TaxID=4460 RepID=A0A843U396_COLES|nr:hypothetical protein [Colocasia esculenta]
MEAPLCTVLPLFMLLLVSTAHGELSATFYERSSPKLEAIVRNSMTNIVSRERRMAASILRLFFHDCFVNVSTQTVATRRYCWRTRRRSRGSRTPSQTGYSIRGMDKIEDVKAKVEAACSGTVSCADILALAARDAVVLLASPACIQAGGPSWTVLLGRRDARMANKSAANINIPSPEWSLATLTSSFSAKGLS